MVMFITSVELIWGRILNFKIISLLLFSGAVNRPVECFTREFCFQTFIHGHLGPLAFVSSSVDFFPGAFLEP